MVYTYEVQLACERKISPSGYRFIYHKHFIHAGPSFYLVRNITMEKIYFCC